MSQMPLPTDAALSQKPISSDVATASHAETDRKNEHVIETSYNDKELEKNNGEVMLYLEDYHRNGLDTLNLKLASDGKTVLIPQPTDDPNDPLNWSSFKKHMILAIISMGAFLGDFQGGLGVPTIILQGAEWNRSPNEINYALNLNIIMVGISGMLFTPMLNYWGRMPVLFWSTLLTLGWTFALCLAPSYEVFYGFRVLEGFTGALGQTIGLALIKDMWCFHQHARKIGIWTCVFVSSAYFGPLFSNFMVGGLNEWRPSYWLLFSLTGLLLVLIVIFGDETYYKRSVPLSDQPRRGNRLSRVVGLWQIKEHSYFAKPLRCYLRLLEVLLKPIIPMSMLFYAMNFMWSIGINVTSSILLQTPVEVGGYGFGYYAAGYIYFTPIVAVFIGEFFGHFFNDKLVSWYVKRHKGIFVPEARLWTNYIGAFLMIPGLVIIGFTLQQHLSYVGIIFGWGMFQFGVMVVSVATIAYVLDSYPTASGEVSACINLGRVCAGFSVGYFQGAWGAAQGYSVSFGLQAVVIAASLIILVMIQLFGAKLRRWAGPVKIGLE